MDENYELMMHVYKAAEMGVYSTENLLDALKTKENKIIHVLESELKEYEKYLKKSEQILTKAGITPKKNSIMSKMGNDVGIAMETLKDNSDAAIASMLIEGFTMGILEMENKISKYSEDCDKEYLKIAKNMLVFQQNEINKLKKFV